MKAALTVLNGALLVLFGTMAMVIGVVCILYLFNLDAGPRLRAELPTLFAALGWFTICTLVTGFAFVGFLRGKPWRWLSEAVMVVALPVPLMMIYRLLT